MARIWKAALVRGDHRRRRAATAAMLAAGWLAWAAMAPAANRGDGAAQARRTNLFTLAAGALVLEHAGQYRDGWSAMNLFDGDPASGWSAPAGALPAAFLIELARPSTIRAIAFDNTKTQEAASPGVSARAVEIWTSADGPESGFAKAADAEVPKGRRVEIAVPSAPVARWIRVVVSSNWGADGPTQLMEIEGYGEPSGPVQPGPSSGVYETNLGGLKLTSDGGLAYGCSDSFTLFGASDGRILTVEWRSADGQRYGAALFVMSAQGDVLNGVSYLAGERQGQWFGRRKSDLRMDCAGTPTSALVGAFAATGRAILYGVSFAPDSSALDAEGSAVLGQLESLLKKDSSLDLIVEGHTDSVDPRDYNLSLSTRRAGAVVDWLIRRRISAVRLSAVGYGQLVAVARDLQRPERQQTRRADGLLQIGALVQPRQEIGIRRQVQPLLARHEHALRPNRQFQVQLQQAEHVGHDRAREPGFQFLQIAADPGCAKRTRHEEVQQFHVKIESAADPFTGRTFAPAEDGDHGERQQQEQQGRGQQRRHQQVVEGRVQHGRGGDARHERQGAAAWRAVEHGLRQDGHDRRVHRVQEGGAEAAGHPQPQVSIRQQSQVIDVLDEGEAGADREADDGRVHEEPDVPPAKRVDQEQGLQRLLGDR
jgi:outer membrane protein OmpA-like peptidoglycan-associated protein